MSTMLPSFEVVVDKHDGIFAPDISVVGQFNRQQYSSCRHQSATFVQSEDYSEMSWLRWIDA